MGHGLWGGCCSGWLGGYGGLGLVGSILSLVLSAALIIGIVIFLIWAVRRLGRGSSSISPLGDSSQSPLDILKVRYASGEITQQEYQDMRKDLK